MSQEVKELHLKAGKKYSFCTCGLSQVLPYCDNAHRAWNEKEKTHYKSLKIFPETDVTIKVSSASWKG